MMEKLWLKHYPNAVPATINADTFPSVDALFNDAVETHQNKIALENLGVKLTFIELQRQVRAFAAYLQQDLGLVKGDRIALMLPNCLQFVVSMLASLKNGLVVVNINPLYTPRELIHQLNDSAPRAIVILANVANTLADALPEVNLEHIIITKLADIFPTPKAVAVNFTLKYIKKMLPRYRIKSALSFRKALRCGRKKTLDPVTVNGDDLAFLQYTGGTTGRAKGAMLTHRNMVANVIQAYTWIEKILRGDNEKVVTPLPLFHIFALTASCLVYFKAGVHNVLVSNARDIPGLVKLFAKNKFMAMMGVNTLFNALANNEAFGRINHHLRLVIAGGMALQKTVAEHWLKVTGTPIIEGYGLTETAPIVSIGRLDNPSYTGSIGLPMSSTEVKIVDDDGHEMDFDQPGELCVRGPQVMQGYWQQEEETREIFLADGFLRTGDIARIDSHGFIYIVDRKKDMIPVAGFNVYPNEVESVLVSHPDVIEAAVVGVPNRITGFSVLAYVVPRIPLTKNELSAFCRQKLVSYKVPRRFKLVSSLPKSSVGKILRRELRVGAKARDMLQKQLNQTL